MFGYIVVNKPEMKIREFDLYQSYYCGLCRSLKERYGKRGQITLSYEMTFLALLLAGYPVILVIVLLRILWKNRTWSFADICMACRDKIEDLMRDLRSRRKTRKEKKEDYDD